MHDARPGVLSLAQATELGTVYTPSELEELVQIAHEHQLRVHLDGARLSNAAASLDLPLHALSFAAGVDAVSFGTSKNGTMNADVVLLASDVTPGCVARSIQKQLGQLSAKHRFLTAQLGAHLNNDVWRTNASRANAAARALADGLTSAGVAISYPVQTNAVFAVLEPILMQALKARYVLLDGGQPGEVRLMTSFATTSDDIAQLLLVAAATNA